MDNLHQAHRSDSPSREFHLSRFDCIGRPRRRAGSVVRTFVVGSATLAILLVCFSIYQSAQISQVAAPKNKAPRFAEPSASVGRADNDNRASNEFSGVQVGGVTVGAGRDLQVSLYPPEGAEPFGELSVREWFPVDGSPNKWRLVNPDIRLWTKDRHGVRLSAQEGFLEGQRKQNGIEVRRGQFVNDVVIEYDRLSRDERAQLPPELRDRVDPSQIVRVETQRIEFDREYGKVLIPGDVRIHSPLDLDFRSADVEVRLDETESRVESLRIGRGGRLELRGFAGQFGLSIPQAGGQANRLTLVDWLRMTLEARLEAQERARVVESAPPKPPAPVTIGPDGVPTFHPHAPKPKKDREDVRYLAKFEEDIDARQYRGDQMVAQLLADVLEVDRTLSREDETPASEPSANRRGPSSKASEVQPSERLMLEWKGVLTVSVAPRWDDASSAPPRSKVTARGKPVRLRHAEGAAECALLVHHPDSASTWLIGSLSQPAVAGSPEQGRLEGVEILTEQSAERLFVRVHGPGVLLPAGADAKAANDASSDGTAESTRIEFGDTLEVVGRTRRMARVDLAAAVSTREARMLDRAAFTGGVRLMEGDTRLIADELDASFSAPARRAARQGIDRIRARGNVSLVRGDSRLSGRALDAQLRLNDAGRMTPVTATISGDASAEEARRSIKARDRMVIDFIESAPVAETADGPNSGAARAKRSWSVGRVRAYGGTTVVDAAQALDLSVEELDATINERNELESAILKGTKDAPAYAGLKDFTVMGREITLNVRDETADIPGEGKMTFRSLKDLDGRRLKEPIPIVVNWSEQMRYRGRENRAVFSGQVHATSETSTTFDTDQLVVEFQDAPAKEPGAAEPSVDWWILQPAIDALRGENDSTAPKLAATRFSKEPARLIATGRAVAVTSEVDPDTGELTGRARLEGPRLSVDLRREVSKMLIEGAGSLLIEDFSEPVAGAGTSQAEPKGLFTMDEESGLSKTLITWKDAMWYDFSIDQVRFEGDADLKYFSGADLARIADLSRWTTRQLPSGRSTFLTADLLTVDFRGRGRPEKRADDGRMGRLSAQALRQFRAAGRVNLQDYRDTLTVTLRADDVVYEQERDLLAIHGADGRPAHMTTQRPRELPVQSTFLRAFYQISKNELEITKPTVR